MSVSLTTLRTALQRRLCDESEAIWTQAELEGYIQEGYDDLTKRTGCLFDTAMLPDVPFAFNITADWEEGYADASMMVSGPAGFTCEFERSYIDNARGPANHNHAWEYHLGYQTMLEVDALADLPESLQEVERATWNTRRISALTSRDLETFDSRYELNKGEVIGYTQDKDGLGVLRKWHVPSAPYSPFTFDAGEDLEIFSFTQTWEEDYFPSGFEENGPLQFTAGGDQPYALSTDLGPGTHNYRWEVSGGYASASSSNDDGFGIIRNLSGIVDISVDSDGFGDLVQVDTVNVFEDFGILGPIYPDTNVVRIEYRRRGQTLSDTQDFEIADRYTVYVRHYAQSQALGREGPGQDLTLAKHFAERYEAGIARMKRRAHAMDYQRAMVMGGGSSLQRKGPPLARLPYNYGTVVRR